VEWWKRGGDVRLRGLEVHAVGVGALLEQIEKLRQELLAEGLLDPSRKKPLPFLPGKVGLICGRDSDAKFDVVKNARRRWAAVQFDIREVAVQGPNCPAAVIGALKELEATADVDVIVITRGGGSVEDLLGFSDEALCRAVAACSKPVVSAIGHEQDRPVLDDVADFRASTPTDAARRIVPDVTEQLTVIAGLRARAAAVVVGVIEREQRGLDGVRSRPVLKQPMGLVDQHVQQLLAARRTALRIVVTAMKHADAQLESLTARMRSLSPANTLARGYAIAYLDDGSLIRDAATIASGTHLRVQVAQGDFAATAD
jgi:exodeoxyribonuclease VII large subunit